MASNSQLTANTANAQASTGPTSVAGKAKSAQNAIKLGLFAQRDFVPETDSEAYELLRDSLIAQLKPAPGLESVFTREIVSASWRLERCAQLEAEFLLPASCEQNEPYFIAIERARAAASRILWRSMSELRKLQNERYIRQELNLADEEGLSGTVEIYKGMSAPTLHNHLRNQNAKSEFDKFLMGYAAPAPKGPAAPQATQIESAEQTQIPRNAACPCGSGAKYKRCCGANAPAVLSGISS